MNRNSGRNAAVLENVMVDYGNNYAEIFNTRQSQWRSEKVVNEIIKSYQKEFDKSNATRQEITEAIVKSKLELVRNSRIITISVESENPEMAMALANCYLKVIKSESEKENIERCNEAVKQIADQAVNCRKEWNKKNTELLEYKTKEKIDTLNSERDTLQISLQKVTTSIAELEGKETLLDEWEKLLTEVKSDPDSFGRLSTGVPRAQEIKTEYDAFQKASAEHAALLVTFTEEHINVKSKADEVESAKRRFLDADERAYAAGRTELRSTRNQLASIREKQLKMRAELSKVSERIASVGSTIDSLEQEKDTCNELLKEAEKALVRAKQEAMANNEIIRTNKEATLPTVPVSPNTIVIFGVGIVFSLMLGVVFVLVIDNLEDTVVNLSDIEGRLALKVLAVLPHVNRKKREQVAKYLIEEKYSHFSETVAGLRNLLDSPRYEAVSRCVLVISTQPGEGKTITSTSLAIAYAQTGRRVLHVDFDLRRPRIAKIWEVELAKERSFSHFLQTSVGKTADFSTLVNKTKIEGLDIICSLPPDGVTPATIFGSSVVSEFFAWARENYDRIIVDAPPFGVVGDVISLAVLADSAIIMCCPDRTHFRPIQYCSRSLTEAGANILGVVVNDVEIANSSAFDLGTHRSYGYKHGYGYGYGYGRTSKNDEDVGDGDNPDVEHSADGSDSGPEAESHSAHDEFADED
jgi:capsular exopolysaccharide synthesis family protein